ncbi:MAG: PilN domain-containing protein [Gammaproteobacteria bacterium]|jgi:Tfp pilus assembly protein PilN
MNHINLLPLAQNVSLSKIKYLKKLFYIGLLLTLIILLIVMSAYEINIVKTEQHIFDVKAKIMQQSGARAAAQSLDEQIKAVTEKMNQIESMHHENQHLLHFLNELPLMIPEDLYLVNLSWHEHSGVIYGQAKDQKTVTRFLNALKDNPYFQTVNLIKSDKRHEKDDAPPIYFVIDFHE